MLYQESNQWRDWHHKVVGVPTTAHPVDFYSSYSTAVHPQLHCLFIKEWHIILFFKKKNLFTFKFSAEEYPRNKLLLHKGVNKNMEKDCAAWKGCRVSYLKLTGCVWHWKINMAKKMPNILCTKHILQRPTGRPVNSIGFYKSCLEKVC